MNDDAIYEYALAAARGVLDNGTPSEHELACVLAAVHLQGGANALRTVVEQPTDCGVFAAYLFAAAEGMLNRTEGTTT